MKTLTTAAAQEGRKARIDRVPRAAPHLTLGHSLLKGQVSGQQGNKVNDSTRSCGDIESLGP